MKLRNFRLARKFRRVDEDEGNCGAKLVVGGRCPFLTDPARSPAEIRLALAQAASITSCWQAVFVNLSGNSDLPLSFLPLRPPGA